MACERPHHRNQVQVAVGDMDCQDPLRLEVLQVKGKSFGIQQMNRNKVARKNIHNQNIIVARPAGSQFIFQGETGITGDDFHPGLTGG